MGDKGTGKSNKITITNDKGRLSQEEIDRMVKEAEDFADEDKKVKEKIDAKNSLESYVYQVKNTIEDDEKVGDKISEEDKEAVQEAVKAAADWLEENSESADKDDFEVKQKELQKVVNPVMSKLYQGEGGPVATLPTRALMIWVMIMMSSKAA